MTLEREGWSFDLAASGPRWRKFPAVLNEIVVYEDGRWYVEAREKGHATGLAATFADAQRIAEAAWRAFQ